MVKGGTTRKTQEEIMDNEEVVQTNQTAQDQDQGDLGELSLELIEEEETSPEGAPGEKVSDEVIEVDGQEVPFKEVIEAYKNKSEWQKSNTQKAQEIAEQKRRLEEEQRRLEEREADLRALESSLYQQISPLQMQQPQKPSTPGELEEYDELEDVDPAMKKILQRLEMQEQRFKEWQEQYQQQQFISQTQAEHQRLKSLYPDYEPTQIERSIIAGRNQFEDVYKAQKYDAILKGDKESILQLIPESIKAELKTEARKEIIEELRKREKARKAISTPQPTKGALPKIPKGKPKSYFEAKQDILETLHEEGLSLTK